jgi:hypothetical protein
MKNAGLAALIGLCTACASQAPPGPPSPTVAKPAATVPARSGVAPTPSLPAATAPDTTTPPAASGISVFNQFDPPVPVQVNR